jgi:carbamoyltransferase
MPQHADRPPLILAIHEDTNANAALLRGPRLLAAVAEERLSRVKYQPGFPRRAVSAVLDIAGVDAADVDEIVAGNRFHFLARMAGEGGLIEGEHDLLGAPHKAYLTLQARFRREGPLARLAEAYSRRALSRRFERPVDLVDHHSAHAWSAWLTSPFAEALAVSIDNMGDGYSARCFHCRDGRCVPLWGSDAVSSPGQFYGEIAQLLGFHVLMAGKVTGLAAHGDPRVAYPQMEALFGLDASETDFVLTPLWTRTRRSGPLAELARMRPADVAAAAQRRLEDVLVAYVQRGLRETGARYVVLAGGVFANVLVNHRLWSLPEVDGVFVHPAMSDQGIAAGAGMAHAASLSGVTPRPIQHVFLGPGYDEEAIGVALERARLVAERPPDMAARVAELILAGEVVARFTGRMEYGPRALGHRSILCRADDPGINQSLNQRLRRTEFMPFAPATPVELAARCYEDYGEGAAHTARFMTMTFRCSSWMRARCPAVVHLDGTARPQVVHPEVDPEYHRILHRVYEACGEPSVINTSFNMHEEPIVCSPDDAIRAFQLGHLDALAIGPFVVRRRRFG